MSTLNIENGNLSTIRYRVIRNQVQSRQSGKEVFCARVSANVKSLREVAETMVREGSKYEADEVYAILAKFTAVVKRLLQEGNAVNVGSLVRFRPSIRGKFETVDQAFSAANHRIVISANAGSVLRDVAANASVTRIDALPTPEILSVYNGTTGTADTVFSEGQIVVNGKYLRWNPEAEDEGFFTSLEGQEMRCTIVSHNLEAGSLFMNITQVANVGDKLAFYFRTRHSATGDLLQVRYDRDLTCEAQTND